MCDELERRERMDDWKYSWNKTRSATESDNEDEEQQQVENEEDASDASTDFGEIATQGERKKTKQKQVEHIMYRCYLAEKKILRKFSRTMSGPLNVDYNGEDICGKDIDGNPVMEVNEEHDSKEKEDTDVGDGYGPVFSSSSDD